MSYETILFEVSGGVAKITLNRPDQANALNAVMARELKEVANICREDAAIRAVIYTGNGKMFSAGGDLRYFSGQGDKLPAALKDMLDDYHTFVSTICTMDTPVITAVNGQAAGVGVSMVAMSNLVIAVDTAKFTLAYTAAGLTPDGSSTYFLPRLIGMRRAEELVLTNRTLTAEEAVEWGLINKAVPAEDLMGTVEELAAKIAQGPTKSYGAARRMLLKSFSSPLTEQLDLEANGIIDASRTADVKEGISAFLEKRKPVFQGK